MKETIKIISDIAIDVYAKLGSGYNEAVYDRAMQVGLRQAGIKYESQKVVELLYLDHYVGEGYADIIVDAGKGKKIVVELKATGSKLGVPEKRQLLNYMELKGIKHGLLINFTQPGKNTEETELDIMPVKQ